MKTSLEHPTINVRKGGPIDLFRLHAKGIPAREIHAQHARSRGILKRLYSKSEPSPGVILGDEVGKGKTYVALACVLNLILEKPSIKVLILTHSQQMADIWYSRLEQVRDKAIRENGAGDFISADIVGSVHDLQKRFSRADTTNVVIGSFERIKKFAATEQNVADLMEALRYTHNVHHKNLSERERRTLVDSFLMRRDGEGYDFRHRLPDSGISSNIAKKIVRECFDPKLKEWIKGKHRQIERYLDRSAADDIRIERRIDLLIVDEAHKFDGEKRHQVVSTLLHKRFERCLYLTATPFALSWRQLHDRITDFSHARSAGTVFDRELQSIEAMLEQFSEAVDTNAAYPDQKRLQSLLGKYLIRASWDHEREREETKWEAEKSPDTMLPTILLERTLYSLDGGERTHIASRRESLCSSWAAAKKSLKENELGDVTGDWDRFFVRSVLDTSQDPKLRHAIQMIGSNIRKAVKSHSHADEKVVIFVNRIATLRALKAALENELKDEIVEYKKAAIRWWRWAKQIADVSGLDLSMAKAVAKVASRAPDSPRINKRGFPKTGFMHWWRRHQSKLTSLDENYNNLVDWAGHGKHLDLVATYDGSTSKGNPLDKFNYLPGAPFVLIATGKGQEGIDLHHRCRRVVLYDLCWNPASMEQRIGRVHRLGGMRKRGQKVEVIYCYQKGTYEGVMAERVMKRCKMMHVLLGAGQWLAEDREKDNLERYKLHFPP